MGGGIFDGGCFGAYMEKELTITVMGNAITVAKLRGGDVVFP